MGVESSISSKLLLIRLVIGVLTVISLEDWVASEWLKYRPCEPAECGDDMKGDFFRNDTKPCNNRSFQNECHGKPLLNLRPFGEYLVDYDNPSLSLSSEFESTGNACFAPTMRPGETDTDASFEPASFLKSIRKPSYLAFIRNCSSFRDFDHPYPHWACSSAGANSSYVTLIGRPEDLHLNRSACEYPVIVPVELARWDIENMKNASYEEKLSHGFRLQWNLTSWERCINCKKGGGKCRERHGCFLCKGDRITFDAEVYENLADIPAWGIVGLSCII